MKKKIPLLLVIFFSIAGAIIYLKNSNNSGIDPASFLPDDVIVVIQQKNLGSILDDFAKTPFVDALRGIHFAKTALDVGIPVKYVNIYQNTKEFFSSPNADLLFREIFSKDFTVALLPATEMIDAQSFLLQNLVLFSKPLHKISLLETLSSVFRENLNITTSTYGEYLIRKIHLNGGYILSITAVDDMLLVTLDERAMRGCLDRFDENKMSVAGNLVYKELHKKFQDADLFIFFNQNHIRQQLLTLYQENEEMVNTVSGIVEKWQGFTAGAYGRWYNDAYTDDLFLAYYEKNKLHQDIKQFFAITPQVDARINQAPAESIAYYWTNTFDSPKLWKIYQIESELSTAEVEEIEKRVLEITGLRLHDLLVMTGNTFSLMITEPSEDDFLPFPNVTLIFELKHKERVNSLLAEIMTKNEIPHNIEAYRGIHMTFWGEEVQNGFQPVFATHNSSLYLASSVKMLKSVIDTIFEKNGLAGNESFKQAAESFALKNNSTGYVNIPASIEVTKSLISILSTMIAIQDRNAAYKSKIVMENIVQPLLDGLSMYSSFTARSYTKDNAINIETRIMKSRKYGNTH